MRKLLVSLALGGMLTVGGLTAPAWGAPLPDNCTKERGEVSCFEGPGKNQAGVGSTNETQGNTTNTSPEPQDLDCTVRPPTSQGEPDSCP
jgi:hypothetical protein